jgi:imidazolonepropionase-like amidohydrolase
MRTIPVLLAFLLVCCASPSDVKVIVGAKLDPGRDNPRLEHSIVVIRDGKFEAVGPQASTPVPKGAQITSGMGKLVTPPPGSSLIAAGEPADLMLRDAATDSVEKTMHDGEWLQ